MTGFNALQALGAHEAGTAARESREQKAGYQEVGNALAVGDYQGASQKAFGMGELQTGMNINNQYEQHLSRMNTQQKAEASQRAENIARVAHSLKGLPYEQRRAALMQQAPMLVQLGMDKNQIDSFDPSDEGIAAIINQVTPLADLLKADKPPTYFAPVETQGGFTQFSNSGAVPIQHSGITPMPEDPASATDANGIRRYLGGDQTGQVVPGFGDPRPRSNGFSFQSPDGTTIQFGGNSQQDGPGFLGGIGPRPVQNSDVKQLADARTATGDVQSVLTNLRQARALVVGDDGEFSGVNPEGGDYGDDNYHTGPYAGAAGQLSRWSGGLVGGGGREKGINYESAIAISKDLGIDKLKALGGNDTERELLTSIETTFGPSKLPETNLRIVDRQIAIMEILALRAPFMAEWQAVNGSTFVTDENGRTYDQALDDFQRSEAEARGLLDPGTEPLPRRTVTRADVEALSDEELLARMGRR